MTVGSAFQGMGKAGSAFVMRHEFGGEQETVQFYIRPDENSGGAVRTGQSTKR